MVEEVHIQRLEYSAEICREDDANDVARPAGLEEVDGGVELGTVKEQKPSVGSCAILCVGIKAVS